mmetsp:Transcript_9132/g.16426  ORF Transcript_9132/g.16426 Transcript_9132/m.16426 type:complete len:566 (+) Transcript_9132:34-1731(+)
MILLILGLESEIESFLDEWLQMGDNAREIRCYYAELEVDRDATEDDLKKAYRKMARIHHPDKNVHGDQAAANARFQLIQNAYDVLSDPHERAWYDAHRDQILRGNDPQYSADSESPADVSHATDVDLWKYFSPGAFSGTDDSSNGMYTVFRDLFSTLDSEERDIRFVDATELRSNSHHAKPAPSFGRSDSEWHEVRAFYAHWEGFSSRKSFAFGDRWKLSDAPGREVRRLMERENKKERARLRKEYNAQVRELIAFVKKRDKRVERRQKEQTLEREREIQRREELAALRAEEMRIENEEIQKKHAQEMEEEWKRVDAMIADMGLNGDESEKEDDLSWNCTVCRKTFRSQKQHENHTKSRKHIEAARRAHEIALDALAESVPNAHDRVDEEDSFDHEIEVSGTEDAEDEIAGEVGEVEAKLSEEKQDEIEEIRTQSVERRKKTKKQMKKQQARIEKMAGVEESAVAEDDGNSFETVEAKVERNLLDDIDETVADSTVGTKKMTRAKLKKLKRKEGASQHSSNTSETRESESNNEQNALTCNVCKQPFPSRNKLFSHVKKTGHALAQ